MLFDLVAELQTSLMPPYAMVSGLVLKFQPCLILRSKILCLNLKKSLMLCWKALSLRFNHLGLCGVRSVFKFQSSWVLRCHVLSPTFRHVGWCAVSSRPYRTKNEHHNSKNKIKVLVQNKKHNKKWNKNNNKSRKTTATCWMIWMLRNKMIFSNILHNPGCYGVRLCAYCTIQSSWVLRCKILSITFTHLECSAIRTCPSYSNIFAALKDFVLNKAVE